MKVQSVAELYALGAAPRAAGLSVEGLTVIDAACLRGLRGYREIAFERVSFFISAADLFAQLNRHLDNLSFIDCQFGAAAPPGGMEQLIRSQNGQEELPAQAEAIVSIDKTQPLVNQTVSFITVQNTEIQLPNAIFGNAEFGLTKIKFNEAKAIQLIAALNQQLAEQEPFSLAQSQALTDERSTQTEPIIDYKPPVANNAVQTECISQPALESASQLSLVMSQAPVSYQASPAPKNESKTCQTDTEAILRGQIQSQLGAELAERVKQQSAYLQQISAGAVVMDQPVAFSDAILQFQKDLVEKTQSFELLRPVAKEEKTPPQKVQFKEEIKQDKIIKTPVAVAESVCPASVQTYTAQPQKPPLAPKLPQKQIPQNSPTQLHYSSSTPAPISVKAEKERAKAPLKESTLRLLALSKPKPENEKPAKEEEPDFPCVSEARLVRLVQQNKQLYEQISLQQKLIEKLLNMKHKPKPAAQKAPVVSQQRRRIQELEDFIESIDHLD